LANDDDRGKNSDEAFKASEKLSRFASGNN
jgi:hypothetical protein